METITTAHTSTPQSPSHFAGSQRTKEALLLTLALTVTNPADGKEPLWRKIFGYADSSKRPPAESVVPGSPKVPTNPIDVKKPAKQEPKPKEQNLPGNHISVGFDDVGQPVITSNGDRFIAGDVYEYIPAKDGGKGGVAVVHAGYEADGKTPIKRYVHLDERTYNTLAGNNYGLQIPDPSRGTPGPGYKLRGFVPHPGTPPKFAPKAK